MPRLIQADEILSGSFADQLALYRDPHLLASLRTSANRVNLLNASRGAAASNFYTHPARTSIIGSLFEIAPETSTRDRSGAATPREVYTDMEKGEAARTGARFNWAPPDPRSQLPSFSRAFNKYMGGIVARDGQDSAAKLGDLIVPSHLVGSNYIRKLEMAQRRIAQARLEAKQKSSLTQGVSVTLQEPDPMPSTSKTTSHRALAHSVVERTSSRESGGENTVDPLPTRWSIDDKWDGIDVGSDGLEVRYTSPKSHSDQGQEACSIRTDHPMPNECGLYYYEVTILSAKANDTTIGIGFSAKQVALSRQPGWESESWGYHGDDGRFYASSSTGKAYSSPFGLGDVVGCGVNFRTATAFFTRNGVPLGTAAHGVHGLLYPSIGLKKTGEVVRANFGQTAFCFNIDRLMEKERAQVQKRIAKANLSNLVPGLSEPELMQSLVLQFLQHDGYLESARKFAEDIERRKRALSFDSDAATDRIIIPDDDDAITRQRIRKAILDGDIDMALKCTNASYPHVFSTHQQVYFRLRCRKFIEMVIRAAELNSGDIGRPRSRNGFTGSGDLESRMDVDTIAPWDRMETEENGDRHTVRSELEELERQIIEYGQDLRVEFRHDPTCEFSKTLAEIWSLLAYPNPLTEPQVAHLLDKDVRASVAEDLNSAILKSLGKSSNAALEKLYAQTSILVEDLARDGGSGAFVSVKGVVEDIPKLNVY